MPPQSGMGAAGVQQPRAQQPRAAAPYAQPYAQYAPPAQPYQPVATVTPGQRSMVYPTSPGAVSPFSVVPPMRSVVTPPQTRSVYGQNSGASQYTAVTSSAYAQEQDFEESLFEDKEKNGGMIFLTICIILLCGLLLYMTGVLDFLKADTSADPSIELDVSSGYQTITEKDIEPVVPVSQTDSVSDADVAPAPTEPVEPTEPVTDTPVSAGFPASFSEADKTELNSFLSGFTEVGFASFSETPTTDELLRFSVTGLGMNSRVYSVLSTPYTYKGTSYKYAVPSNEVNDRILRYFGSDHSPYASQFDSGNGWFFYQDQFYFPKLETSKGFALVTSYTDDGTVTFNIYESDGNDSEHYSLPAEKAAAEGLTLIGTGTATVRKSDYNGRQVYNLVSYEAAYNN